MTNKYEQAKKLAEDNYSTWGQWVVECMGMKEITASFQRYDESGEMTLNEWVEIREAVGDHHQDIMDTAW